MPQARAESPGKEPSISIHADGTLNIAAMESTKRARVHGGGRIPSMEWGMTAAKFQALVITYNVFSG